MPLCGSVSVIASNIAIGSGNSLRQSSCCKKDVSDRQLHSFLSYGDVIAVIAQYACVTSVTGRDYYITSGYVHSYI